LEQTSLKIEHAEYLITVDSERRIIRDAAIVVENGMIRAVGRTEDLLSVQTDRVIDATRKVVTPGFVNGHMHLSYAHPVRGIFPDGMPNRLATVFAMQSVMTAEEEYFTTLMCLNELVRGGTTTLVDPGTTQFPEACMAAYEAAGCRIATGEQVSDVEASLNIPVYDTDSAVSRMRASVESLHGRLDGRLRAWTMPFSHSTCSPDLLVAAKQVADDHETMMTLHHSGGRGSASQTPTEKLHELGVLGPNVLLSHAMGLEDSDIELVAESGAKVAICPSTVLKNGANTRLGGRLPEFLAAGIPVSLATDSANSSNFLDMVRAASLAATIYKDVRGEPDLVSPETAVELITRSGAQALGLDDSVGAIEVGFKADIVMFDATRPAWRSLKHPVRNLVYSATADSVDTVIIDGVVRVEDGRATFIDDEEELIAQIERIGDRIRDRVGMDFVPDWPIT
jgi:5-methylthioadenosine/S-adenosylhomocysteine deaminase